MEESNLKIICLKSEAFYALIEEVVARIQNNSATKEYKWIDTVTAMKRLDISSKTTLQRYRDQGLIKFSQPNKKTIVYDADSIDEFLEKNSNKPV